MRFGSDRRGEWEVVASGGGSGGGPSGCGSGVGTTIEVTGEVTGGFVGKSAETLKLSFHILSFSATLTMVQDDDSSAGSPPSPPLEHVPQYMLRALVNHNHNLIEENKQLQAWLEIYEAKMNRKKKKLENARLLEKMRKKDYDDVSRKLWDENILVDKLRKTVKYLKGKCPCNR
ncbi:hypothetical protein L6452_33014 [Arctium lappa]|uniref:Uncharacterized protein n=1 Tax=Arctium lappa TaxID=4217 RepID=A0ACB8Z745_ARCLA|nr:hypothetical protein L6452_33014 [Arctium lappa]